MEQKEEKVLEMLSDTDNLYLKRSGGKCEKKFENDEGKFNFFSLYKVEEITFEDKAPRKEALENVISSMNMEGVNFVYIIKGNQNGVSFYYGVAKDFSKESPMEIADIGTHILKPSLQGNFRGSRIAELDANEKQKLLEEIDEMEQAKILEGVPGINKDDENFQSVDRIVDVMLGNEFALMLIVKPMSQHEILATQKKMYSLYDLMNPISKLSTQESIGESKGNSTSETTNDSKTKGTNQTNTKQESEGESESSTNGENSGTNISTTEGTSHSNSKEKDGNSNSTSKTSSGTKGSSKGKNSSKTLGSSKTHGTSQATGSTVSETKGTSTAITTNAGTNSAKTTTLELVNKKIQEWLKYIDEVINARIDYGMGKGLFVSSAVIYGKQKADLIKLENTIRSIYGGESGNRIPLKAFELNEEEQSYVRCMQIPTIRFDKKIDEQEQNLRTICSQIITSEEALLGSWMSSKELSLFAGLPQKEVVGLALREEVDFGLNVTYGGKNPVLLGHLIQSGTVFNGTQDVPNIEVNFEKEYFDKHIFVTGVTGSGKTTTCQKLLLEGDENFMVIEPAKTEYRILTEKFDDLLVFTLGKETAAPFRLNPFEFFPGESITSRVDMVKASMEAAFDMEAAIPQVLEAAMYQCYENKGWDIATSRNKDYENPYKGGVCAFPTLSDLDQSIEKVVKEQGFDARLRDDYIGSVRARLKGLMVGAKGLMLDTPRSLDFKELLDKKVVIELENVKSSSEKSLIMGFILGNLLEAIKAKYNEEQKTIQHITLIEEAHRLLSKYMPGDSLNKKQGVEMFSDMLAEVRKYGESLIIADQIPNKLTPEVLKNTNTKIVHKIFAQDDKEAIGNTMALKDEQKEYLSYLDVGCAIMVHPGLSKAIQLKISQTDDNNTERIPPKDSNLRERCLKYYASVYQSGILPGLENLKTEPTPKQLEIYLEHLQPNSGLMKEYRDAAKKHKVRKELVESMNIVSEAFGISIIVRCFKQIIYDEKKIAKYPEFDKALENAIQQILKQGTELKMETLDKINYLENF